MNLPGIRTLFLLPLIIAALVPAATALPPDEASAWREDLEAYHAGLLANHIDPYHRISEAAFLAELEQLSSALDDLTEDEVIVRLMALTRRIGDGHTSLPLWRPYPMRRFPVEVTLIDDMPYITGIDATQAQWLGARVISVDGTAASAITQALGEVVPFVENEHSRARRTGDYFSASQLLSGLGFLSDPDRARFALERDGQHTVLALAAMDRTAIDGTDFARLDMRDEEYLTSAMIEAPGIYYSWIAEQNAGYIRFDTYPGEADMNAFAEAVTTHIGDQNVEALIIDFRGSYGGNFFMGLLLSSWLILEDGLDWQNGFYVLTSNTTFSAAMSNSAQFSDILNARRIGQPTGANPCGYQDMASFSLPNSGLLITTSKRRYCFARVAGDTLPPDVLIPVTIEDYRAERDRVMEWVLDDIGSRRTPH
ncbi:S41 family peptidase [Hyphobacterium indicum]|uniref:hypothetical protein n=1 Tax=Hyphobacterium indicum TaxID=2162714 RepID=UPI000D64CCA1|nr:hypothetical protein [Hyphobacterium indicum]